MLAGKKLVVVLGMHRSGTSTIARALKVLGISLGENLMAAKDENPKGFWEDLDVVALNNTILAALDQKYDTVAPIYPDTLNISALDAFKTEAIALLSEKMKDIDNFGLKDPRMAKLLPFWQSVFNSLKLNVHYVIATRHPKSIAQSLEKRDQFSHEKSYLLWFEHLLWSLTETQGTPRVVIDYDALIANPVQALQHIANLLQCTIDEKSTDYIEYTQNFLDKNLAHSQYTLDALRCEPYVTEDMIALYQLTHAATENTAVLEEKASIVCLASLKRALKNNHPALCHIKALEDNLQAYAEEIHRLSKRLKQFSPYRYCYYILHPWKVPELIKRKLNASF